jgi:hypothetical protein
MKLARSLLCAFAIGAPVSAADIACGYFGQRSAGFEGEILDMARRNEPQKVPHSEARLALMRARCPKIDIEDVITSHCDRRCLSQAVVDLFSDWKSSDGHAAETLPNTLLWFMAAYPKEFFAHAQQERAEFERFLAHVQFVDWNEGRDNIQMERMRIALIAHFEKMASPLAKSAAAAIRKQTVRVID